MNVQIVMFTDNTVLLTCYSANSKCGKHTRLLTEHTSFLSTFYFGNDSCMLFKFLFKFLLRWKQSLTLLLSLFFMSSPAVLH